MKKVIGFLNTGMPGCSVADAFLFDDDISDEKISEFIYDSAIEWASSYRDIEWNYVEETEDYVEGSDFEYAENIECHWEIFDAEKHEDEHSGDGTFTEEFERLEARHES